MNGEPEEHEPETQTPISPWIEEFLQSPAYDRLPECHRLKAHAVINIFATQCRDRFGIEPADWNVGDTQECCLEVLPRKVTGEIAFFEAVAPVLREFFAFLDEKQWLPQAQALAKAVTDLDSGIVAAATDSRNWGPAKHFAMAALAKGVDMQDQDAINQFMMEYNERIARALPRSPAWPELAPARSAPQIPATAPRSEPKVGRNDPCPCGSGKKYKKCCQ